MLSVHPLHFQHPEKVAIPFNPSACPTRELAAWAPISVHASQVTATFVATFPSGPSGPAPGDLRPGKSPSAETRSALKHNLFRRLRAKLQVSIDPSAVTRRATMAEHDLTAKLAKSMDRHLVFPLLEWLSAKELYPEDQIQQGKLDLLNKTNMLDYAMEIFTQLNNRDPPQELKERRTEVVQNLRKLQVSSLGSRDGTG